MPIQGPPTIKPPSTQPAPARLPQAPKTPQPQQLTPQALLALLNDIDTQLAALVKLAAPVDSGPPAGILAIDSATGTALSDVITRQGPNLCLEVYASGASPSATITVLDASIGGTPQQAVDTQAVRVLTGNTKYVVAGIQDEIQIKVAATAGTWSVRLSFVGPTLPGGGQANGATATFSLSATSPGSATTAVGATITGLGVYRSLEILATIQGGTGGTLDIYLQVSPDGGTTWVDYVHFSQLAAAAAATSRLITVSKQSSSGGTPVAVGTGTTPALAANTVVGGDFGDRMRVLFVSGAGTSAGAAQTILLMAST